MTATNSRAQGSIKLARTRQRLLSFHPQPGVSYISRNLWRELKLAALNLLIAVGVFLYLRYLGLELWKALPVVLLILLNMKTHLSRAMRLLSGGYGEEEVFRELRKRLRGHYVFRNLYTGRGDIDILVVGPGGVHVVEVKRLKGTVMAGRGSVKYGKRELLDQLERNEEHVKRLLRREGLEVPVKGHLVVLGRVRGRNEKLVRSVGELTKKIKKGAVLDSFTVRDVASLFFR